MWESTLKVELIPQLKRAMMGNTVYQKLIDSLDKRLIFVSQVGNSVKDIIRNISNSKPLPNNFKTSETFVIMNDANDLAYFTDPVKFLGRRFIIDSMDDTGLRKINVMFGFRNFIFPCFYSTYKTLVESGLVAIWDRLFVTLSRLTRMLIHGKNMYKRYYAQINSGIQFQPEFHQCAPVSVEALVHMFAICGTLWSIGWIVLLLECSHK